MVVGGFDLSIGANAGFTVMLCAIGLVLLAWPTVAVVPIALAGGLLIGALNGLLIVRLRVPDLLATLGMLFVLQGVQLLPSRGQSISHRRRARRARSTRASSPTRSSTSGAGELFGEIPVPIVIFAVVGDRAVGRARAHALGPHALRDRRQRRGRAARGRARATGCGWPPTWSPACSPRSAASSSPRGSARATSAPATPFLLDAVAAALVGYAVLAVNRPNVLGTAVGAVFLGIMLNGLTIKNFPYYTQDFVKGVVLMVALLLTFGVRRLR